MIPPAADHRTTFFTRHKWALAVAFVVLGLGVAATVWHALEVSRAERTAAGTEAFARGTLIEFQFSRALKAAEMLASTARQNGGLIPNFAKMASDLYAAFPELASVELQPGGVVSEIVPRAGNERAIGFNVFKDPSHHPSATTAAQQRLPHAAVPLPLYSGEPGLVIRVPLLQRRPDGKDQFWGFAAVSMRLADASARAKLEELTARGFGYQVFVNGPAGKPIQIERRGRVSSQSAPQRVIRVQNAELRFAVSSQKSHLLELAVEIAAVFLAAGLSFLLAREAIEGRKVRNLAGDATRQLSLATAARKQAQDDLARLRGGAETSETEVKKLKLELDNAKAALAAADHDLQETKDARIQLTAHGEEAEARLKELQARLDESTRTLLDQEHARKTEIEAAQAAVMIAEEKVRALAKQLAAAEEELGKTAAAVEARPTNYNQEKSALEEQLQAEIGNAKKASEENASMLQQVMQLRHDLRKQEARAETAEAQIAELTAALQRAEAFIEKTSSTASPGVTVPPAPATETPQESSAEPEAESLESEKRAETPAMAAEETSPSPAPVGRKSAPESSARAKVESPEEAKPTHPTAVAHEPPPQPAKSKKRSRKGDDRQPDLFGHGTAEVESGAPTEEKDADGEQEERKAPARRSSGTMAVDVNELRRAVNELFPLLVDNDPGAKDCLKGNTKIFRASLGNGYDEFEQLVKGSKSQDALEHLRRVARRHGINV